MLSREDIICQQDQKDKLISTERHDTMNLLSLFIGNSIKIKPSVYLKELTLNTEDRLDQLNRSSSKTILHKDFKITPSLILFQSFKVGKQYSATLTVCNISSKCQDISVHSQPSLVFSVGFQSKVCSKLAPGISLHLLVKFTPHDYQDYTYTVMIQTEHYSFGIEIKALGQRPLVDFPDSLELNTTLVRMQSSSSWFIRNIGQVEAIFNISCEKPFSVNPDRCILGVGKTTMMTTQFRPDTINDFSRNMFIHFESGEELIMELKGSSKEGIIELSPDSIQFADTFMGLKRQEKVTLHNATDVTVHFSWHKFETLQKDLQELERLKGFFEEVKLGETILCNKLEFNEVINQEALSNVYSRILNDQVSMLSEHDLLFTNQYFEIFPSRGEVPPGARCEVTVQFVARIVGEHECTAYCDVTGRAARLPLRVAGRGLAPVIKLSHRTLDIGNVFLGSTQAYEIVAANKGHIPGGIIHKQHPIIYGGTLTCEPDSQCLKPGEIKSFVISFSSSRTGQFVEEVVFENVQSGEELKMLLKGRVVNPTISFDSSKIDFGCVSVGFPCCRTICLVNKSQVPVAFALRVPGDGHEQPTSCEEFAAADFDAKPALLSHCKEFTITPSTGVLDPDSSLPIEVCLLMNTSRGLVLASLVAENKNSRLSEPVSVNILYESRVAELVARPAELLLRFCFVQFQYKLQFTLVNASPVPGYFLIPSQSGLVERCINYETDVKEGLLGPGEEVLVNMTVTPIVVGRVRQEVMLFTFGKSALGTVCSIACTAQGPNVSANVETLNFGKMTLMEEKTLSFELANDSPIGAYFIVLAEEKLQTRWSVAPHSGRLQPGESTAVSVTLTVVDPGPVNNTLHVQVENSRSITIGLLGSASGRGIVINPNIFPDIDLGNLFSRRLYQFTFSISNPGSRHHLIQLISDRLSIKSGTVSSSLNFFKFIPNKFEIAGGASTEVILEGQSNREQEVCEGFVCWAVINKRGLRQHLGTIQIKANFVVPMLELSTSVLFFDINIGPDNSQGQICIKSLELCSVASLPVTVVLELGRPFVILECGDTEPFSETMLSLEEGEKASIRIGFQPPEQPNLQSTTYTGVLSISYKEHPQKDKVNLKGKLNFPNLAFSQHSVEFGCVPADFQASAEVFMTNPTPLPVNFKFSWNQSSIIITQFEKENLENLLGAELPEDFKQDPLCHNRLLSLVGDVESLMAPVPLMYAEPDCYNFPNIDTGFVNTIPSDEDFAQPMHNMIFPIFEPYFNAETPTPEFKILPSRTSHRIDISQVFELTPTYGVLAPYQQQGVSVGFRPPPMMGFEAEAVCRVDGGPAETLRLTGQSAGHLFSLSSTIINFGFRVFMEPCEETITLSNLGRLAFRFKVSPCASVQPIDDSDDVEVGKVTVEPPFGQVPAHGSVKIMVKFYPGLAGEFQQQFTIQVAYLEPVVVVVSGHGVVPQVSLNQPRVARPRLPIAWTYQAVAALTAPRFAHLVNGCHTPDQPPPQMDDWVVIDYSDKFPTNEDIWLAIERVVAHNFVKENRTYFSQHKVSKISTKLVPPLLLPGYVLDFDSIVAGTTTEVTVMIENRGLVRCDIGLSLSVSDKKLKTEGIYVSFQNHVGLPVGRSVPLYITLKPTITRSSKTEQLHHFTIHLQMDNGGIVPLYVRLLLTIPHIIVDKDIINYGKVRCGQRLKISLLMKNSGAVDAEWTVNLVHLKRKRRRSKVPGEEEEPFSVNKKCGLFAPKTAGLLEIAFSPQEERIYESILELEVKHNPDKVIVNLVGSGSEPKISIEPELVQFGSHIPHSGKAYREFTVTNTSPFNIEVYFSDFDSLISKEDRLLRVLTHFYNADKMLLPLDLYENKPKRELYEFYYNLIEAICSQEKTRGSILSNNGNSIIERSNSITSSIKSRSTVKSQVNPCEKSYFEHLCAGSSSSIGANARTTVLSPEKTEEYLHDLLNKKTHIIGFPEDPLNLNKKTIQRPVQEPKDRLKGIFIIFHGAPHSDYVFWANRTGIKLQLSVSNMDDIILQEAAVCLKASALQLQDSINTAYAESILGRDELELESEDDANTVVTYEELARRVEYLKTAKEKIVKNKDVKKSPGSKKSQTKKSTSKPGTANKKALVPPTFGDIPVDVFVDLVENRLLEAAESGIVLESLTGFFLKNVTTAVEVILKSVGHISCLKFISMFNTLEQHLTWKRRCNLKLELERKAEEEEKAQLFEQMTAEELDELSSADRQLLEQTVVAERRHMANERPQHPSPPSSLSKSKKSKKSLSKDGKKKKRKESVVSKTSTRGQSEVRSPSTSKKKGSSKSKKRSAKPRGSNEKDLLEEKFMKYQLELEELVKLLGRWNKHSKQYENLEKPSLLFNINRPKSRKGIESKYSKSDSIADIVDKDAIGVSCSIVRLPQNPNSAWFNGLIKYLSITEGFTQSKKIEKDWFDITVPDPLPLACIIKPEVREQNVNLNSFSIYDKDYFQEEAEITLINFEDVFENQPTCSTEEDALEKTSVTLAPSGDVEESIVNRSNLESESYYVENNLLNAGSVEQDSISSGETDVTEDARFTTRVELAPGQTRIWRVNFEPKTIAAFSQLVTLEVGGWWKQYKVSMEAVCDIPRVDTNPQAVFEKVHETLSSTNISNCVFLLNKNLFYFGPVFATPANQNRTNDLSTNFYFTNKSAINAKIVFNFMNNSESPDLSFGFSPKQLLVTPGETKALEVFACPQSIGKYEETLVYTICNNPVPGFIKMTCLGVRPEFEFEPRQVRFERVLLHRREVCQLALTNKSYKPLGWRLVGLSMLGEQVSWSDQSGVIPGLQSVAVFINFHAQVVEVSIHEIRIEVYDDQFRGEPFISEPIEVILESVDVLVDIIFPKSNSTEVKFKAVKVGEPENQTIVLKNKGKYNVTFQIKFNDVKLDFKPENVFSFSPKSGVLPKLEKSVPVKISCLCLEPVHVSRAPLFKVWLVDTGPLAQPVAAIPVLVTVDAFTSKYKVVPEHELVFGPMLVGTSKTEQIIVQNTGKFEFTFQIQTLEQLQAELLLQSNLEKARTKISSKSSKGKRSKSQERKPVKRGKGLARKILDQWPSLSTGVFSLSHSGGLVLPGQSFTVDVECTAESQNDYCQEVVVKPLDFSWAKKRGSHIKIKASVYLPSIDFDDLKYIFQEAIMFQPDVLKEGAPRVAYCPVRNELWFANTCVGVEQSVALHLRNTGLVEADAHVSSKVFSVSPTQFAIPSHSEITLTVAFRPTQIGSVSDQLTVRVGTVADRGQEMVTRLRGEAHLPLIRVTDPPSTSPSNTLLLSLPPALVGQSSRGVISFLNCGHIDCTVIMEVYGNNKKWFSFEFDLNVASPNKDGAYHTVCLVPGQVCEVGVEFTPDASGLATCQLKLMPSHNPYEDKAVRVEAEGYTRPVVLDNLPLADHTSSIGLKYKVKLSAGAIGNDVRNQFVMRNQTSDQTFRFEWARHEGVTFSPSTGHLLPLTSKDITLTFITNQPTYFKKEEIECTLMGIQFLNMDSLPSVGWDDHQKTVKWVEQDLEEDPDSSGPRREVIVLEEPPYEQVPGSGTSLILQLSARADYSRLICPTSTVHFPPTVILQAEEHQLLLSNPGRVPASFSWRVLDQLRNASQRSLTLDYGPVTMSAEWPKLTSVAVKRKQAPTRPATCPHSPPGPIPSSVALWSQDDSAVKLPHQNKHVTFVTSNITKSDSSVWPISVEPLCGTILPEKQMACLVKFRPNEVSNYMCNLQLSVTNTNLESDLGVKLVPVEASSRLPGCHLVVDNTDCAKSSDSMSIHFNVLGVGKPVHKSVSVVNTTMEDYSFNWTELTQRTLSPFSCSVPFSKLNSSKYLEVMFSFTPSESGAFKSSWLLTVPERQIEQVVELVGVSSEPVVVLSSLFLRLNPVVKGVKSEGHMHLHNQEDRDLRFRVDPNSLICGSWGQTLQVRPMRGVLPARGIAELNVWVVPTEAGQGQFRVALSVELLREPLSLTVSAECYSMLPLLVYYDLTGSSQQLVCDKDNAICLGVVESHLPVDLRFSLTNAGRLAMHYNWLLAPLACDQLTVRAATTAGLVGPQARQPLDIQVTVHARTTFTNVKLQLMISKGPTYVILLSGTAAQPLYKFSFSHHDFGPCYVQTTDAEYCKTNLVFTNCDDKALLVESEFLDRPHLRVGLTQVRVEPRSELNIPVTFLPREVQPYSDTITLLVDSSHSYSVTVVGRGIPFSVLLVDPAHKLLSLEGVMVGGNVTRVVQIINKGERNVRATLALELPVEVMSLTPTGHLTLRPNQPQSVSVVFSPHTVLKNIQQQLVLTFQDHTLVLSSVKASSVGVSVRLDREHVPFGSTVVGNTASSRLLLSNCGDLAVKFSWAIENKVFSISPQQGDSGPGTDVVFTLSYVPNRLAANQQCRAVCSLSNGSELAIIMSGSCVDLPAPSSILPLSCPVRQYATATIPAYNKFGREVVLTVSVSGQYFSGDQSASVPPRSTHLFEITYSPLAPTNPTQPHKGTAVLYMADGSCLVHSLEGTAGPPSCSGRLEAETHTHIAHTMRVPVRNWLQIPQIFRVSCDLESSSAVSPIYQVECNEYLQVSGSQERDLTLRLVCHTPSTLLFKLTLTNERNGDYCWSEVQYSVLPCEPLQRIAMSTVVRTAVTHQLVVDNPLSSPVTFLAFIDPPDTSLTVLDFPITVDANRQGTVTLQYFPLWPCHLRHCRLELSSPELGLFPYSISLSALPPPPEPALLLSCELGQAASVDVILHNPSQQPASFHCTVGGLISSLTKPDVEQSLKDHNEEDNSKSILKKNADEQTEIRPKEAKRIIQWDEMNVAATLHPLGKDYGLDKISERPTVFERVNPEDDVGVDAVLLAQQMEEAVRKGSIFSYDSQFSESETPEERMRRNMFEQKRKEHYSGYSTAKLRPSLLDEDSDYDDGDNDFHYDNDTRQSFSEAVTVENSVVVEPGGSRAVKVIFEPSTLADTSTHILASSPQTGYFLFPVFGTCLVPQPRGPFSLSLTSPAVLTLKNVFTQPKTFLFTLDKSEFAVEETSKSVEPGQVFEVVVYMVDREPKQFSRFPVTGKLTVTLAPEPGTHSHSAPVNWVFYLRGLYDSS